jgi:hypothetical protein
MRKTAIILLAMTSLSLGATSQAFADQSDLQFNRMKDFKAALAAVDRLSDQQTAKCEMDAHQYLDEHPAVPKTEWRSRFDLCMRAAGWQTMTTASSWHGLLAEDYQRAREISVASGKEPKRPRLVRSGGR